MIPDRETYDDDVNPVCGHPRHLLCLGCGTCVACDDCYCGED